MTTINDTFNNFWNARGTENRFNPFGIGSIGTSKAGTATWTNPIGNVVKFQRDTPLSQIYQSDPYAAKALDSLFPDQTFGLAPESSPDSTFSIPTDLYPTSTSKQSSHSSGRSHSGINWNSPLSKGLLPSLLSTGQNLQGLTENMGQTLQDQYANLMRRALQPQAFQGTLNDLASKRMLNSTVAKDALSSAGKGIARMVADQAFNSQLAQQQAQMKVPQTLANLISLSQETNQSNKSSSSSSARSSNPLEPYELMSQMLRYQPSV